jgi:proline dehydrogenase
MKAQKFELIKSLLKNIEIKIAKFDTQPELQRLWQGVKQEVADKAAQNKSSFKSSLGVFLEECKRAERSASGGNKMDIGIAISYLESIDKDLKVLNDEDIKWEELIAVIS